MITSKSRANTSIQRQFIFLVIGIGGLIAFFLFLYSLVSITYHEKERFIAESMMEGKLVSDFVISPLVFEDREGAQENLQILTSHKAVKQVIIYTKNKQLFARYNTDNYPFPSSHQLVNGFNKNEWWLFDDQVYRIYIPIEFKNELLGYLYMEKESSAIWNYSVNALIAFVIFSLIIIVIVTGIAIKQSQMILEPVILLVESMQNIAKNKNYTVRVQYRGSNEIARLYVATNALLEETQNLTEELERRVAARTKELQESLENLKLTQTQLIESEKMAALGNLVSGVAHEVNTPLGNALTGGSIIHNEAKQIQKSLSDGSLKRSVMDEKLSVIIQSASLLVKSLTHAAELVKSFKNISVDQSIDILREFDVHHYLLEILQAYHNKLKHQNIEVEVLAPEVLMVYSYPGTYAQIFNNLLNNALLHAFDNKESGAKITIELEEKGNHLQIRFSDNGTGIDKKVRSTIFEPFVTTKRNAGGTGLGMNIIYNLVTQKLGGTIRFSTAENEGTTFEIILPFPKKSAPA